MDGGPVHLNLSGLEPASPLGSFDLTGIDSLTIDGLAGNDRSSWIRVMSMFMPEVSYLGCLRYRRAGFPLTNIGGLWFAYGWAL
jgi:hypothetical protein